MDDCPSRRDFMRVGAAGAASGGRFVAVGRTTDIKGLVRNGTQSFDAKGTTVAIHEKRCYSTDRDR